MNTHYAPSQKQALIVDDLETYQQQFATLVSAHNYLPTIVNNPVDAWRNLSRTAFQLIICDNTMILPIRDPNDSFDYYTNDGLDVKLGSTTLTNFSTNQGLQLLRRVKSIPQLQKIPFILCTSDTYAKDTATNMGAIFVDKDLPALNHELLLLGTDSWLKRLCLKYALQHD